MEFQDPHPLKQPSRPGSFLHRTLSILFPPAGKRFHDRYQQRNDLLFFDTMLSLIAFFLIGVNIFFLTGEEPLIDSSPPIHESRELLRPVDDEGVALPTPTVSSTNTMPGTDLVSRSIRDVAVSETSQIFQFVAEARYEGDAGIQFGYGPLPPRVGKTTGYRIFWALRAGSDILRAVQIRATLPDRVTWGGHETISHGTDLSLKGREIVWDVGDIGADDGSLLGSFEVSITPQEQDEGKTLTLLSSSAVSAEADHGSRSTLRTTALLTTNLHEARDTEQGLVQE